jgi:NTE family protein
MLHEGARSGSVADWVDAVDAHRVFQVTGPRTAERLARAVAGCSVGVVMSGGGARAYAHIGAVKAMRERRVPIDFLGGASMGAVIAACVAMGWSDDEIEARVRDAFVSSNPLGDHVLPVVALTRGQRVEERLKRHFGDTLIEDLETPFFCTSSEMTRGVTRIHRRGLLRDALRASISLPGILPPVVAAGELLVDGAVMNNFPTDLMNSLHRGVTIGVDVAREGSISPEAFADPPGFLSWVWRHGFRSAPPIVSLLMRAATSRQELRPRESPADILVAPPVAGVQLRDWKSYDLAVIDGYAATLGALDREWSKLAPIVAAGMPDQG